METAVVEKETTPKWLGVLQEWKAVAWPLFAAAFAALLYFLGSAANAGRVAALGIRGTIVAPTVNQEVFLRGAMVLMSLALIAAGIVLLGIPLKWLLWEKVEDSAAAIPVSCLGIFLLVGGAIRLSNWSLLDADSMILKPLNTNPSVRWNTSSIFSNIHLAFIAVVLVCLLFFAAWALGFLRTSGTRMLFTLAFVGPIAVALMSQFAFAFGVHNVLGSSYPIVTFSNSEQYFAKDSIAVMLASDDKLFAFLVVSPAKENSAPGKILLYVPRTEVKWVTVLRTEQLRDIAYYHDFKPKNSP